MSNEQMKVLSMISEGTISAEEGTQLLARVGRGESLSEIMSEDSAGEENQIEEVEEVIEENEPPTLENPGEELAWGEAAEVDVEIEAEVGQDEAEASGFWGQVRQFFSGTRIRETVEEELEWTVDGAEVDHISAETTNGSIALAGSERDQVLVQARKIVKAPSLKAAEAFAQQVQITVEQDGQTLKISKDHPKPPFGVEVAISYQIASPTESDATLRTTNGSIDLNSLTGAADLTTANGEIQLDRVSGQVAAKTTNGSIKADIEELQESGSFTTVNGSIKVGAVRGNVPITASTTNGAVTLTLPPDYSGQLTSKTVNGRVKTDFPTQLTRQSRTYLEGEIGDGGETELALQTVNGSIRLRKQAQ